MDFIFGWAPYIRYSNLVSIMLYYKDIKDCSVHQILQRAHRNFKRPIKICNLNVFKWDMGHLSIKYFMGPSSFWSRIIPDLSFTIQRKYVNNSN